MITRIFLLLNMFLLPLYAQPWWAFLDPSRAVDWSSAGFAIPSYSAPCATQPTLTANDVTASVANSASIQSALNSCDSTHNVVSIPAGTYYVAGWKYSTQSNQVVRGAGPNATYVYLTGLVACGFWSGVCMGNGAINVTNAVYNPGGPNVCSWIGTDGVSGTYNQGSTSLLLQGCGATFAASVVPGNVIFLDQANDVTDTGGDIVCNSRQDAIFPCTVEIGAYSGRFIGGVSYSQVQSVTVKSVTNLGNGQYTVTISPGNYFNNIRTSQSPGAWWGTLQQSDGLENITIDQGLYDIYVPSMTGFTIGNYVKGVTSGTTAWIVGMQTTSHLQLNVRNMVGSFTAGETIQESTTLNGPPDGITGVANYWEDPNASIALITCNQCWVKNVRALYGGRSSVLIFTSPNSVVRDSYFYGVKGTHSKSYGIEIELTSRTLIENNIFQQTTGPIVFGQGTGNVLGYNFNIDNLFTPATWMVMPSAAHNTASSFNLWEGNNLNGVNADPIHGTSNSNTYFRNLLLGWQSGKLNATYPISIETYNRGYNAVGNVLGQPGYHKFYEAYATTKQCLAADNCVNMHDATNTSIYTLGYTGAGDTTHPTLGDCGGSPYNPQCDPLVRATLMRWGNYDVVTSGVKWDPNEASPAAVPYINANFASSYFSFLPHVLPASLYYSACAPPSWWPTGKPWPAIGPDVTTGDPQWAKHANTIPAQDCYLNVMQGPPDGSGGLLNFDGHTCYGN